ncbi:MAG: transporter substrate-binding domain-containing protein, partial [Chitinispirillales bacterium]|nr:transporter substrate-binding domain-containing protein [Chitinispirillales bacterium]
MENLKKGKRRSRVIAMILSATAAAAVILLSVLEMGSGLDEHQNKGSPYAFTRLQDIPGITKADIAAVEAIRGQFDTLIFANMEGTELFVNKNGQPDGFIALFSEWLADVFKIPFKPVAYDWDDVLKGLKDGSIHFAGELTPNEER